MDGQNNRERGKDRMRFLTLDVVKWGLLIGSVFFCSIQLSGIAARLRNIDRALTVLTINSLMPDLVKEIEGEIKE